MLNGIEEEMEIINYFGHHHPLRWVPEIHEFSFFCCGCYINYCPGEAGYMCSENCSFALHDDCAEMPRQIRHPLHTAHPLMQEFGDGDISCEVCGRDVPHLRYRCSQGCKWWVHLCCTEGSVQVPSNEQVMKHWSHPQHELRMLRREKRLCSFRCDACGTTEKGSSYICSICQYWIHESCAALPRVAHFNHHHHSLSLAFQLPSEYYFYRYRCGLCDMTLRLRNWVYHCRLCRYAVHVKCATNPSLAAPPTSINNETTVDVPKDIVNVPLKNIYEDIIRPFIQRERGEISIPLEDGKIAGEKYKFHKHHHPLSLINFPPSSSRYHIEEHEEGDDDDDISPRSEMKCDGCTTPIHGESSSTTSYLSCDDCKYYLHLACFSLLPELSSHPLHPLEDHYLILRHANKLSHDHWSYCRICRYRTNGLYYACKYPNCGFQLDIKCASLPDTIKHAAHSHDHHYLKLITHEDEAQFILGSCYHDIEPVNDPFYKCERCTFSMCCRCMFLPERNKHILDKHWLPLTYDAHVNHPSDFICGSCEENMNPKSWMYYCRECEESFHPECFPSTSGKHRNINFGTHQYYISEHPNHPLRFQLITKKKRCDLCDGETYDRPGFQCVSCNFVMCLKSCARKHMNAFKVID